MGAFQNHLNRICEYYISLGFEMPDIGLLQPAEPFLDTAGEEMRRRVFMTSDLGGKHLCLRPEFTIPVCMQYLKSNQTTANYAYGGSVFRQQKNQNGNDPIEFLQAGIEAIGQENRIQADADCINNALKALDQLGQNRLTITIGDHAIFDAVLEALELPDAWQKRLSRAFGDDNKLNSELAFISGKSDRIGDIDLELKTLLDNQDRQLIVAWIEEQMVQSNLPLSGGRTAGEIAHRMIEKHDIAASRIEEKGLIALQSYLGLNENGSDAAAKLTQFSREFNLDIEVEINNFEERFALIDQAHKANGDFRFQANFGRRLDYYSGVVFEIAAPNSPAPICGGGRYDHLMALLGANDEIPAIGYSIWLDRLAGAKS